MKSKIITRISLIIFMITFLMGCGADMVKPKAPKLPGVQEEIREELKRILRSDAKLTNVINGENKNAVQLIDLDNDGEEEVVIFYIIENDPDPLRVLVLKKEDGKWIEKDEIKGVGYGVDRVYYEDVTGDGNREIIIGWQLTDWMNKGVGVYQWDGKNIKEIFVESYEEMTLYDFDGDGKTEIFLVKLDRDEFKSSGELFKYGFNDMKLLSTTELDGGVNGHTNVVAGKVSENKNGVIIDSGLGAHSGLTELLVYEGNAFKNIFSDLEDNGILNPYMVVSGDYDEDGILEIPILREPMGYEGVAMAYISWITVWNKWDGKDGLYPIAEAYYNYSDGYYFKFPAKWDKKVTIDVSNEDLGNSKVVFSYLRNPKSKKRPLFAINTFSLKQWKELGKYHSEKYIEIQRNIDKVYVVNIIDDSFKMALNEEEIKQNFFLLEE